MKKSKIDLARNLKKTKQKNFLKLILLPSIGFLSIGLLYYGLHHSPWHWQLFIRWLFRQGDVSYIPEKLHRELNILCYTRNRHGQVSSYGGSIELSYSLGKFQCQPSRDGNYWIIQDIYTFASPDEAAAGTHLAILLVSLVGTDYSYKIEAIIPIE